MHASHSWVLTHPIAPKFLNLRVRYQHTTERDENSNDQRINQRGKYSVWRIGRNELADTGVDKLVDEHDEKHGTCLGRVTGKTGSVVEADVVEDGAYDEVRDLRDDEAGDERDPRVHLRLLLTCFVDVATVDEEGLQLRNHTWCDENVIEQSEENELLVGYGVANLPETEPD